MLRIHCTELTGIRVGRRRSRVVYGAGFEISSSLVQIPPSFLNLFLVILFSTPRPRYVNSQLVACGFPSDGILIKAVMFYLE